MTDPIKSLAPQVFFKFRGTLSLFKFSITAPVVVFLLTALIVITPFLRKSYPNGQVEYDKQGW